jgi:hypothetical protein
MTATLEQIRQIWRDEVFANASITAITTKVIEQDITEATHKEVSRLRHDNKINFFAFRVSRSIEPLLMGKYRLRFFVDLSYTVFADPSGANYNAALDAIETLQDVYLAQLGSTWGGLVAYGEPQPTEPAVSVISILNEPCFKADYNFQAFICNI